MQTVLITRPREEALKTVEAFENEGFKCVVFPMIELLPIGGWALPNPANYAAAIFTSANAVGFFFKPLSTQEPGLFSRILQMNYYAVGIKTKQALEEYGVHSIIFSEKGSAEDLAATLLRQGVNQKRFLFVRGAVSRRTIPETIAQNGGFCDELCVYDNRPPSQMNRSNLREWLQENQIDWIAFFSPSAVENFFKIVSPAEINSKIKFAVIGETTQNALMHKGFRASAIPEKTTAEALIEEMKKNL